MRTGTLSPLSLALLTALLLPRAQADCVAKGQDIFDLDLDDLTEVKVFAPARRAQTLPDAPGVVSVLQRDDIARFGARDVMDILQRLPALFPYGSSYQRDNVADIRAQRSVASDRHTLVLLNGFPMRDAVFGGSDRVVFKGLSVDAIERIEYIRGPGSVVYGSNAMSGVINIVTRTPSRRWVSAASIGVGSDHARELRANLSRGESSRGFDVHLRHREHDGWPFAAFDRTGVFKRVLFGERDTSLMASGSLAGFDAQAYIANSNFLTLGPVPVWPETDASNRVRHTSVSRTFSLSPCWTLDVAAIYHGYVQRSQRREARAPETGQPDRIDVDARTRSVEMNLRGEAAGWNWLFGSTYSDLGSGGGVSGASAPISVQDQWTSVYAQMDRPLFEHTQLTLGAAWYDGGRQQSQLIPRLTLVQHLNEHSGVKLNIGEAFRAPYLQETGANAPGVLIGNPLLKPERNLTRELQWFLRLPRSAYAITVFETHYEDLINFLPMTGSTALTPRNVGELRVKGGELEGEWLLGDIRIMSSVSHQENQNEWGRSDVQLVPNLMLKNGVAWQISEQWRVGLFDTWFGAPARRPGVQRNPQGKDHHHLSLHLRWQASKPGAQSESWQLQAYIDNALQSDPVFYPDAARPDVNTLPLRPGRRYGLTLGVGF